MYEQDAQQPLSMSAMAVTGFVIGLVALLTSFLPFINNFSFVLGLLAFIFSIVGLVGCARGKKKGKGLAIAALIISLLSCVVVIWSQSIYSAAIDDALSTTKAATTTTKASTSTTKTSSSSTNFSSAASDAKVNSEDATTDSTSEQDSTNASTVAGVNDTVSSTAETPIEAADTAEEYAYQISIEEFTVSETYDGKPCALVTFMFTNNSDEETSFMVAVDAEAYQNGVELDTGIVSGVDGDMSKHVKPGATVTVQKAYVLDDQSDVTIECTEMFAWDDVILAKATFSVA